jgi:gamma-glutamyltranspeptidase/glutathione hydrolase
MEFHDVPVKQLISKDHADKLRNMIDPDKAANRIDTGRKQTDIGDTVYLSVADSAGNMVSLIQSNYRGIGSGVCPPGLGFGLQDRGELFCLDDGHANIYAPGKRPFHTIIPGFVTRDGEPWLSFGVMGGATQPQAQAWVLMNIIDFGMNLQEAGDAPRVVHVGSSQPTGSVMTDGGEVALESGFDANVIEKLVRLGHTIGSRKGLFGGYQAVMKDSQHGVWVGASESRKDGHAAGY